MTLTAPNRYDRTTIWHHWIVAALVIGLWVAGQTIDWLPKGPLRASLWQTHVLFGFVLTVALVSRIVWRTFAGRRLPGVGTAPIRTLAAIVHVALYGLLALVIAIGIANAFNRGTDIYGLVTLPQIGDKELKKALTAYHGLAANLLLALVALHAGAALLHHYVWRDDVLRRMRLGPSR